MKELAKKICIYNGQKGTENQIEKCLKSFKYSEVLMLQFCNLRIINLLIGEGSSPQN